MTIIPVHFGKTTTGEEAAEHYKDQIRGKTVLITGASAGLGAHFAKVISKHEPGLLILTGRSETSLERTRAAILADAPDARIKSLVIDLASLESVRKGAAEILSFGQKIDVNVQNAGVMAVPEGKTVDGFETTFGTNHLGPFLLTNLLLLAGSTPPAPPRSVIISSEGQRLFPDGVNYEQPGYVVGQPDVYDTWRAYGASKAANVLFARALRRRGWEAASVHPGVILDTELARSMTREEMIAIGFIAEDGTPNPAWQPKSLTQGVAGHVVAAFAPADALFPTADTPAPYIDDAQVRNDRVAVRSQGVEREDKLWQLSEKLVGQVFA